jgi:hypothetical protein
VGGLNISLTAMGHLQRKMLNNCQKEPWQWSLKTPTKSGTTGARSVTSRDPFAKGPGSSLAALAGSVVGSSAAAEK